jgi:ketosteroid isomerase-like protein
MSCGTMSNCSAGLWPQFGPTPGGQRDAVHRRVFECLDPEVAWHWPLTDEAFRGREAMVRAATDFLEAVDDWRIEVDELVDAGGDQVFAVQRISARGKGSGTPFEKNIFTALKVRDGKVWRIYDYTERAEALKPWGWRSRGCRRTRPEPDPWCQPPGRPNGAGRLCAPAYARLQQCKRLAGAGPGQMIGRSIGL